MYLAVMGISLLVSLLVLAGLKLVQLERHQIQQQNNRIAASQYAGTALALAKLNPPRPRQGAPAAGWATDPVA